MLEKRVELKLAHLLFRTGKKSDLISRLSDADEQGIRSLATKPDGKRYASRAAAPQPDAVKPRVSDQTGLVREKIYSSHRFLTTQAQPAHSPRPSAMSNKQGTTSADIQLPSEVSDASPSEHSATPPTSPFHPSTGPSTSQTGTTQTPLETSPGGAGTISTASMPSTMEGGGPETPIGLDSTQHLTGDASVGQGLDNHGIGHFTRKAKGPVQQQVSNAEPNTAKEAASQLWTALGTWETQTLHSLERRSGVVMQPWSTEIAQEHKAESFKFEDRQMNDKERRGAWLLGGTMVGGWLLSGLLGPQKRRSTELS